MCDFKSALVLKDRIYVPDHNDHSKMLEELEIKDVSQNPNFVRVELHPKDGNVFTVIKDWQFVVDQDFKPDWFVYEYEDERVRTAIQEWCKTTLLYLMVVDIF